MLRNINSGIYKNTEIFQQISDYQAAFISGGSEQNLVEQNLVSDILSDVGVGELTSNLSNPSLPEPLNSVIPNFPLDVSSFVAPVTL